MAGADAHRYGVVGDPIDHSLSPQLHQQFAIATAQAMVYERARVPLGQLAGFLTEFRDQGGRGLNVTLPLKLEALELATWVGRRAQIAGAANTLWWDRAGTLCAENTDGVGLVRDLQTTLDWPVRGARVLILGAGGSVHGVVPELLDAGVASISVLNRSSARAFKLQQYLATWGYRIRVLQTDEPMGIGCDLLINATSVGVAGGELPALPPDLDFSSLHFYDLQYGPKAQAFAEHLAECGVASYSDGLGMLVEQAAQAFWIWRGIRPDTRAVRDGLRSAGTVAAPR